MPRLIDAMKTVTKISKKVTPLIGSPIAQHIYDVILQCIAEAPTVDAYTAHEVAEIIADLFGDTCACNFNRIDEWLPEKCELLDACPDTVGVACWEQYLKYRSAKMDGDGNG